MLRKLGLLLCKLGLYKYEIEFIKNRKNYEIILNKCTIKKLKGIVKYCDVDMWYIDFEGLSKDFSKEFINVTDLENILNIELQDGDIVEIEIKIKS